MTRPRKRIRRGHLPNPARSADAALPPPSALEDTPSPISSRIEVKGLDLELVSTPRVASPKAARLISAPRASVASAGDLSAALADAIIEASERADATEDENVTLGESALRQSESLRTELTQIGAVLDLPAKAVNRPTAASVAAVRQSHAFTLNLSQWIAGAIVFIGAGIAAAMLRTPPLPTLPPELLGEWTTSNPQYQGRQLAFVESQIVMRVSEDAPLTRYPIIGLTSHTVADTTLLGLTYSTEGGEVELHARLVGRDRPSLVFDRPSGLVWERRIE